MSSIPSLSPFGKIIDVRRCAVMSAFSREYISTADAEPLVLAAMDNTTSVRVVKADVDQHGLVEGLREIIRSRFTQDEMIQQQQHWSFT